MVSGLNESAASRRLRSGVSGSQRKSAVFSDPGEPQFPFPLQRNLSGLLSIIGSMRSVWVNNLPASTPMA